MPVYEYECKNCKNIYSVLLKFKDSEKKQLCTNCGAFGNKIISGSNFHLKGDGWFKSSEKK